jgi:hypothetical protein
VPLSKIKGALISDETVLQQALVKFPRSINKYEYKSTWTEADDNIFMCIAANDNTLKEIGGLTGSLLARHAYQNIVYVGSIDKEGCNKAILKLDIARGYAVSPQPMPCSTRCQLTREKIKKPMQSHVFYEEDCISFKVSLRPLHTCKKQVLESTYFDNLESGYDAFHEMLRPQMRVHTEHRSIFEPYKWGKHVAVTPESQRYLPLKYWQSWTYEAHGTDQVLNEQEAASLRTRSTASNDSITDSTNTTNEVTGSVQELASNSTVVGWVETLPITYRLLSSDESATNSKVVVKPSWDTYEEYGQGEVVPIQRFERRPFQDKKAITRAPEASTAVTATSTALAVPNQLATSQSSSTQHQIDAANHLNISQAHRPVCISLLDDPTPELLGHPSLFQLSGNDRAFSLVQKSMTPAGINTPAPDPEMPLIDLSDNEAPQDRLQRNYEVLTRKYHSTMYQGASRPRKTGARVTLTLTLTYLESPR